MLSKLASARNAEDVLDSYQPPQPAYKALSKKLAEARGIKDDNDPAQIARGPGARTTATDKKSKQTILMADARVPALREKLGLPAVRDDTFYDKPLPTRSPNSRRNRDLPPTGQLTNHDRRRAQRPKRERDATTIIIANMERWRWMPRDLGKTYVMVNIPDYTLQRLQRRHSRSGRPSVVVGKPDACRRRC